MYAIRLNVFFVFVFPYTWLSGLPGETKCNAGTIILIHGRVAVQVSK